MREEDSRKEDCLVSRHDGYCAARFQAMASPCELLVDGDDIELTRKLAGIVVAEARRIEQKFSRYRADNIVAAINASAGKPVLIDAEVQRLLAYANTCYSLSAGAFDITSGVLRRVWKFDGSDRLPDAAQVAALLPLLGWEKVHWDAQQVTLPAGMEIDFGGIAKEYAVDRALQLAGAQCGMSLLVNFGGDLAVRSDVNLPPALSREWTIGVEAPDGGVATLLKIRNGAMATSGDARRFLQKDGVRYGHILDPRTGWPVPDAPRSVTVVAASCVEAGTLSTLAILRGREAAEFLAAQDVQHWVLW